MESAPEFVFPWYLYFTTISVFLGACIGSFLNVCIYRIPLEQSVVAPGSHCFSCGKDVAPYDNIPVVSYLILRGKCRHCRSPYASRYMFVEILVAVLFYLVWASWSADGSPVIFQMSHFSTVWIVPVYWLFIGLLVLGAFVDYDHRILPDRVTIGGAILGLLCSMLVPQLHGPDLQHWWEGLTVSALGAGIGFSVLWAVGWLGKLVFRKEAMGFGDVKLMAAIGAFLGWQATLFALMVGSFIGAVVGLTLIGLRLRKKEDMIPFGPFLALATVIWIFWGQTWWILYKQYIFAGQFQGSY